MMGKVYLVGAGPGDGELLTLKGRRLLESADVIVYDRLVGREIMEMVPEGTEKIDVGKNAGRHPVPQHEINEILLAQAKAGRTVVRLKGGDPFLFGRGGEELEKLAENGIDFEVVPGITSSLAVPAYAGIPVTHRDYCSSLHIITGHARAGADLAIDFDALVRLQGTLVFMMSVATIGRIADGLLAAGMDPGMPCAVIENGTMPQQRKFTAPLTEIERTVRENGVHSPAVILVGKVAELSDAFDWFGKRPLLGRRVIVTQPAARSSRLAEGLRRLGADVVLHPCIRTEFIRPLEIPNGLRRQDDPRDGDAAAEPFDTLVFTSAEGVRSYCSWLLESGQDMRALAGKKIAVIGSATAAALKEFGLAADFMPTEYSGEALGKEMVEDGFVTEGSRVLLLRTTAASHDVTDALAAAEVPFEDVPVYRTEILGAAQGTDAAACANSKAADAADSEETSSDSPDLVTFTSRSCVEGYLKSCGSDRFDGQKALCIGRKTAEAAAAAGFDITVSDTATIESMLAKAEDMFGGGLK